ncbi:hypothetical protein [Methylomonas sp. UP202]|uniref:hypothetical protein n=1 Tax=Methylomonas sp. UP202 TaxID=3040943 RepID=UPI00247A140C|nr:hypothetical protein [Methylomonas sp. UP202]WGS87784.1 hypothetical protein QC632_08490 [Methylomonas sp. UP202]
MLIESQYGVNATIRPCRLCGEQRGLSISHALPNSAFVSALREGSGKVVAIVDDQTTPIQFSSDTWGVELLCATCEDKLNRKLDAYGIAVLKGQIGTVLRSDYGVTFRGIDRQRFRAFFLSILWRISVSSHASYSNIDLPTHWENELHLALKFDQKISGSKYTVAIYRLRDSTPDGFTSESLRSIVTAPFARDYEGKFVSVCFICFGFLVEIFLSKLPSKIKNKVGVLVGSNSIFMAPFQEIFDIPELVNMMGSGLYKRDIGLSQID